MKKTPQQGHQESGPSQPATLGKQSFDLFFVLDFEATCDDVRNYPNQEIIEFPIVVVDAKTFEITTEFHRYVRPVWNPKLTNFCTDLTGIQQVLDSSSSPLRPPTWPRQGS